MRPPATGEGTVTVPEPAEDSLSQRSLTCHAPAGSAAMKAARIALRSAAPLAGASAGSSIGRLPQEVEQFSRFSPSPLSIKQLLDFGEGRGERRGGRVGEQPRLGARRLVSLWRSESEGCRGRRAGAALCRTEGRVIPAQGGPLSAGAEVAVALRLGCPAPGRRRGAGPPRIPSPGGGGGGEVASGGHPRPQLPGGQVPGAGDL